MHLSLNNIEFQFGPMVVPAFHQFASDALKLLDRNLIILHQDGDGTQANNVLK